MKIAITGNVAINLEIETSEAPPPTEAQDIKLQAAKYLEV